MAKSKTLKVIIILLLAFTVFVALCSVFAVTNVYASDSDPNSLPITDADRTKLVQDASSPFYWVWWAIGVGVLCIFIVIKELLAYNYRWGIYGDLKMPKRLEKKINTRSSKKAVYTKDHEIRSVLAGNKTVEIDTNTCLLKKQK